MITLYEWQKIIKPNIDIIFQASTIEETECSDGITKSSIGYSYNFYKVKDQLDKIQLGYHENTVLCCYNAYTDQIRRKNNHITRLIIQEILRKNNIFNNQAESIQYFHSLPNYKFVISPEGNGIDTHRTYESLMAGCIPIVEDNEIMRNKYEGCPILWTKDYSEINEEYLNEKYKEMINNSYDFSKLFLSSWSKEEQDNIKRRGNYWMYRLLGIIWY